MWRQKEKDRGGIKKEGGCGIGETKKVQLMYSTWVLKPAEAKGDQAVKRL